jgi:ribosomal protein S18 acetylase RimI-like enzyme
LKIVDFNSSKFSLDDLIAFFEYINNEFTPTLKDRLILKSDVRTLKEYAIKLSTKGEISICTEKDEIIGIITFYANDPIGKIAYIPFIGISPKYRSQGVARSLLIFSINEITKLGFLQINVETWLNNTKAINMFTSFGFDKMATDGFNLKLTKKL